MNLILATALADDHRRDLMLDAEDRRQIRLAHSPISKRPSKRSWTRAFRARPRQHHRFIGYRDWLTAGRL